MSTPNYSPDGLTYDDITALQREVAQELRREGYPKPWSPAPSSPPLCEDREQRRHASQPTQQHRPRRSAPPSRPAPRKRRTRQPAPRDDATTERRSADR
jgi:hypothetical protein